MNPNTIGIPIVRLQYGDAMLLKLGKFHNLRGPGFQILGISVCYFSFCYQTLKKEAIQKTCLFLLRSLYIVETKSFSRNHLSYLHFIDNKKDFLQNHLNNFYAIYNKQCKIRPV